MVRIEDLKYQKKITFWNYILFELSQPILKVKKNHFKIQIIINFKFNIFFTWFLFRFILKQLNVENNKSITNILRFIFICLNFYRK